MRQWEVFTRTSVESGYSDFMFFIIRNTYIDCPELADVRPAHREYLAELIPAGLRAAGPLPQASPPGGFLIFEADSQEVVEKLLAPDPLHVHKLIVSQTIEPWSPVIGNTFTEN